MASISLSLAACAGNWLISRLFYLKGVQNRRAIKERWERDYIVYVFSCARLCGDHCILECCAWKLYAGYVFCLLALVSGLINFLKKYFENIYREFHVYLYS